MTRGSSSILLAGALLLAAGPARADEAGAKLAREVARAAGIKAWPRVRVVRFGWHNRVRNKLRRYVWDVRRGQVSCRSGKRTVSVPHRGWSAAKAVGKTARSAHKGWINDDFWAMAALHLAWDRGVTFQDLGRVDVPWFPALGKRRALSVRYGEHSGGYTPGDRYVLYLGKDHLPVAWAFHRGGQRNPTMVTTWEKYVTRGGLTLPTRFGLPGGAAVITIDGLRVETDPAAPKHAPLPAPRKPATRPTTRPAGR